MSQLLLNGITFTLNLCVFYQVFQKVFVFLLNSTEHTEQNLSYSI